MAGAIRDRESARRLKCLCQRARRIHGLLKLQGDLRRAAVRGFACLRKGVVAEDAPGEDEREENDRAGHHDYDRDERDAHLPLQSHYCPPSKNEFEKVSRAAHRRLLGWS